MNEITAAAHAILQGAAAGFGLSVAGAFIFAGVASLLALLFVARSAR